MDETRTPPRGARDDAGALHGALHLVVPPAVFIAHFGLAYGLTGLACAFGWQWTPGAVLGPAQVAVLTLTALAVAVLFGVRPRDRLKPSVAGDVTDPYDPRERTHFLALAARMTTWLAAAGVLAVGVTALLARPCT